ncbi:MAG: RNase A-like domain-containing protein [Elusimicrobiota bacterium]
MASALKTLIAAALLMTAASVRAQDACQDLRRRARWLCNGANNCDAAVAQGQMSSCQVSVTFSLADVPSLAGTVPADVPWLTSPAAARDLAAKLDAMKCVQKLEITVDPPGPFQPGDKFTITAKVTMANSASPEGLIVSLTPKDEGLIAFNDIGADNGTRVAHKAGKAAGPASPLPPGAAAIKLPFAANGTASVQATYHPSDAGALPGTPDDEIDAALEKLKDMLIGGAATAALVIEFSNTKKCGLGPQDDVRDRFVDATRLAEGYLQIHERNGGHTIKEHVGKSQRYLLVRLRSPHLEDASSYNDLATAEKNIRDAVAARKGAITAWYLDDTKIPLPIQVPGNVAAGPIGYSVSTGNGDPTPVPKYDVLAVLRKATKCRVLILTSYPE